MRILHLISSGGMYGAEAVILNLSHGLRQLGDESAIASFSNASRQLHDRALAEGLTAVEVPCQGQVSLQALRAVRKAAEDFKADVVHAHGFKADLYAWMALSRRAVPLVSTCHTWYDNDLAVRLYGRLDRWALGRYAAVVAVSAAVEQRLLGSGARAARIRRIRNGIDQRPFSAAAAARSRQERTRPLRVGLVGRLAPEKGVDVFIEAAGMVARELPEVEFMVAGEGPGRPQLEAQVERLGLTGRMRLEGHQSFMVDVYGGLDLLVSASRLEGLPIALLEGMASGLPVVATAVGEVPTLVQPDETGLLVPPDDPVALAAGMVALLNDDERRLMLGRKARAKMEREFSVDRMTTEYREVYREVLKEHS